FNKDFLSVRYQPVRALRLRERGVYWGAGEEAWKIRAGPGRHRLPRRDRFASAGSSSKAAAGTPGASSRATGWRATNVSGCPRARRDEHGSAAGGESWNVS